MSLHRCYHAHKETHSPPTRGARPSPGAAPTTPAHAKSPSPPKAKPPCNPECPPPDHPSTAPRRPPRHHRKSYGNALSAKHHAQAAKRQPPKGTPRPDPGGAQKNDTNKREQHRTQTRPATTSRQTNAPPCAGTLYKNFYPNRLVFSMNEIVASIIILFIEIFRLSLPYKSKSRKVIESMSVISKSGTSAS